MMETVTTIRLSSWYEMPLLGLGTWQAKSEEVEAAVEAALAAGYRHIDTAFNYNNEEAIGRAIARWLAVEGNSRDDLFIVSKLPNIGNRAADVQNYLQLSLSRLQLQYLDLYLIHMPFGLLPDPSGEAPAISDDGSISLDMSTDHVSLWLEMELQVNAGRARSVGLSNFNQEQLKRILDMAHIRPAVLQVEMHAYLQQPELKTFCAANGIALTAFSPLGSPGASVHFKAKYNYDLQRSESLPQLLDHPQILELCTKHNKTPAQVLLRHLVQQSIVVIPKSVNPARIAENSQIFDFELEQDEMTSLSALNVGEKGRIFDFLFFKSVETHPEYPFKPKTSEDVVAAPESVESAPSQSVDEEAIDALPVSS